MTLRPTHRAVIDTGHQCNLRCKMCYHKHEIESAKFESTAVLKGQILEAKNRGNNYIDFTGGSPELHPGIIDLVKYADSLGIKSCIITAGIIGRNHTANLLAAGVNDFLVSVHGTAETCNDIMRLKGGGKFNARERQERFLRQLVEAGQSFRFNACMLRQNQNDLVATAKWMLQWKPRIVNWIQMNPHGNWSADIAGTKSVIADLDVLEGQLSAAIPILLDAGIGVNVRYYPMCRIPEAFRQHACNDLQVMHDPMEWDYGTSPKTFKAYMAKAQSFSISNEWKAQPCQSCDLRNICGGINSAFYRATGDKACIHAIKDPNVVKNDPFFYRRHNTVCLTPRVPLEKKMCIAAIADENMAAYVPLFLYCATKNYPDYDVLVFATYPAKSCARAVSDRHMGQGVYDGCVIDVHEEMAHYGTDPNATRAIRFVEFEKYLGDHENVLWTDIDILFQPDGDIPQKHLDRMALDGTGCFENYVTIYGGKTRLCGVHFLTKEWWGKTRQARLSASERIMNSVGLSWDSDEENLFKITSESGLEIPPHRNSDISRHHGVHLGDFLAELKGKGPAPKTTQISQWIRDLFSDSAFVKMFEDCADVSDNLRMVFDKLTLMVQNMPAAKQVSASAINGPPKKKNPFDHYDGSFIIFTVVDEAYQWYIPMFARSLEMAYPGQKSVVVVRSGSTVDVKNMLSKFKNNCTVELSSDGAAPLSGWTTAAYRFTGAPNKVLECDFCLITDIDIMFMPESVSIVDQHMRCLKSEALECYDNMVSERRGSDVRLPGVHFVTRDWWKKTEEQRRIEYKKLSEDGATEYCYDEYMLGRIVKNSGLKLPSNPLRLQWQHGVHIGDWRLAMAQKRQVFSNVFQKMHISSLLKDEIFMAQLKFASEEIKFLKKIEKEWIKLLQ